MPIWHFKFRLRRRRRSFPYAFTEQGVAMFSSVLNSERAVAVNIGTMRAFVKLRQLLASNAELAALEQKYDAQFKVVFDAIRQLMSPPAKPRRRPRRIRRCYFGHSLTRFHDFRSHRM